jgi:hypothetical protein
MARVGDGPCLNSASVLSRTTANGRDSDPLMKPPSQPLPWPFVHMLLAIVAALILTVEAALPVAIRTDEKTLSFIAITQRAPPPEICKIDDPVRLKPANITDELEIRPSTADAVAALALEPAKVPSSFITASDATPRMPAENTDVVVMPAGLGKPEVTHVHAETHDCLVPLSTATTDTITDVELEPAMDLASDAERHLLTADDTGDSVVQAGRQVTHAHAQTHPCLVVSLSIVTTDTITHFASRRTSRLATAPSWRWPPSSRPSRRTRHTRTQCQQPLTSSTVEYHDG